MCKKLISLLLVFVFCFSLVSCDKKRTKFSKTIFDYFDTVTSISGYFDSEAEFNKSFEKIKTTLKNYHKLFDIYNNYEGINNIKTINDNAGIKPVEVDEKIIELLMFSKKMYQKTEQTVNICAGPLIILWKNSLSNGSLPKEKDIYKIKELIDFDNLVINDKKNTVYLKKIGCSIDVGAVAKGFVCEKIKPILNSIGFENGVVSIGGNVLTVGFKSNNAPFNVGIKNPDKNEILYNVLVSDTSVVTSGDYERFYEIDGQRYNHIIDPATLFPAKQNKSVTIICNDSALADALSTALFILHYEDGLNLINSIENCESLVIDADGQEHFSSGFKKYLNK